MFVHVTQDLSAADQVAYRDLVARWPVLETGVNGEPIEYYVLDLRSH